MKHGDHTRLDQLVLETSQGFDLVFTAMIHEDKKRARTLLIYIDKVFEYLLLRNDEANVKGTHLHLPIVLQDQKALVLEYLLIKLFYRALEGDNGHSDHIAAKIGALTFQLERNQVPDNASAKNGGNREYKKWKAQWERTRSERSFLQAINCSHKSFLPSIVINGQQNDLEGFEENLYATTFEQLSKWRSYVLLNDKKFTKLVNDLAKSELLRGIKTILLFDYAGRDIFRDCDINSLSRYHEVGVEIKDLIIVTFGAESFRLKKQITRCASVNKRYFNQSQPTRPYLGSHVFDKSEIELLLHQEPSRPSIHWIGEKNTALDAFIDITHGLELHELRTIHVFNLFMIAITPAVASYIVQDLFNDQIEEGLFRSEVRAQVSSLNEEQKGLLKDCISALLAQITPLWTGGKHRIKELAVGRALALIVPYPLVNDRVFLKELNSMLDQAKFTTYSWRDMKNMLIDEKLIITLNYKDPGRYPFDVFPSIVEHKLNPEVEFHALFFKMLFAKRFKNCTKEYVITQNTMLRNPFRRRYFGWTTNEYAIDQTDLTDEEVLEDIDDQEYDMHDPAEMIKVTYSDGDHSSFYPSKQLIIGDKHKYKVIRADQLSDQSIGYGIQPLDDIHADLNLFEISREEESELESIKKSFGLRDPRTVLWKVLLKEKRGQYLNDQALYDTVAQLIGDHEFVRFQHFRINWLDPASDLLIPRKRRHFRSICEYLDLPQSYYRLKLKKRASITQNTRQSNQKKNRLLAQMFNERSFDDDMIWTGAKFQHLLDAHDLEEHGMTEDNVDQEIKALADLLRENISIRSIQKIEFP